MYKLHNKFCDKRFVWQDFIEIINYAFDIKNPKGSNYGSKEIVGSINFWHKLTLTIDSISPKAEIMFSTIKNQIEALVDKKCQGYFAIISFTNKEPSTGRHTDPVDIAYLQCIGKAEWVVGEDKVLLSPGDLLLVKAGVAHEVYSLTPRTAVSFMFHSH
jgi:mannose-6-phosphate isomerase-like protein (cupin superfamily)